jgi:phage terminase large subunit GpA-like protein
MIAFASPAPVVRAASVAFRPPRRVSVSQGAQSALMIRQPGGYSGAWSPTETPYMIEPMNMLASRAHEAVCFVGPARTGKTMGLLDGWVSHCVTNDPGDMLITQMSQDKAREFSKTRIDRAIRNSPLLRELMSTRGHDDNTHDKLFRHGMWLKIGWPSASQMSSSDYRYVGLTDYDRFPDDIDGEGSAYQLGLKRTQTFLSRGMLMVESSPGRDYTDATWKPGTPHEGPPVTGIGGIYNRSDRRRWYWQCPDCSEYFEASPGLKLFATLPPEDELMDMVRGADLSAMAERAANVVCPHCGSIIEQRWKPHLNRVETARWVADGQGVSRDGELIGEAPRSSIAGFWLGGVAAAYQKWDSLILRYLQGLREYVMSGSDLTLKATINTDQGMPYLPRALLADVTKGIEDRVEDLPRFIVPDWTRFMVAAVDVQGGKGARFVVQVHAIGEHMEQAIVDRYDITESVRGVGVRIDPAGYPEDWDVLTDKVVKATYRIADGREMMIRRMGVDLGGEAGVTPNAQAWFQRVRAAGLGDRVRLTKGAGVRQKEPVIEAKMTAKKSRQITPYLSVATDYFKDQIAASKKRETPGPAYMHFPSWLKQTWFDELNAETRGKDGKWRNASNRRNESLDLWVIVNAIAYNLDPNNPAKQFNWESPPVWAMPIDGNSYVVTKEDRRQMKQPAPVKRSQIAKSEWSSRL